jgi:hypothetical protein
MKLNKLSRLLFDNHSNQWEYNISHSPFTVQYLHQKYNNLKEGHRLVHNWEVLGFIKKQLGKEGHMIGDDVKKWLELDEIPPKEFLELLEVDWNVLDTTHEMDREEYRLNMKRNFKVKWFRHQVNPLVDSKVLLSHPMEITDCIIQMREYQQKYYQTDRCSEWISLVLPKVVSHYIHIRTGEYHEMRTEPIRLMM